MPEIEPLRRLAKTAVIRSLGALGQRKIPAGVPILCYHSIDDSGSFVSTSEKLFRRQMDYLTARGYRTMRLADLCDDMRLGNPLPERAVVLTFDDGIRNNLTVAAPVLKEHGFNATIFVVTDCVGQTTRWAKTVPLPEFDLASWDELGRLQDSGWDIQAHTATHPDLTALCLEAIRDEIGQSKIEIESRLGRPVTLFAYPYGGFQPTMWPMLETLGFTGAVTTGFDHVRPDAPRFGLPRINVTEVSAVSPETQMAFFEASLAGTGSWYVRMKRLLPSSLKYPVCLRPETRVA